MTNRLDRIMAALALRVGETPPPAEVEFLKSRGCEVEARHAIALTLAMAGSRHAERIWHVCVPLSDATLGEVLEANVGFDGLPSNIRYLDFVEAHRIYIDMVYDGSDDTVADICEALRRDYVRLGAVLSETRGAARALLREADGDGTLRAITEEALAMFAEGMTNAYQFADFAETAMTLCNVSPEDWEYICGAVADMAYRVVRMDFVKHNMCSPPPSPELARFVEVMEDNGDMDDLKRNLFPLMDVCGLRPSYILCLVRRIREVCGWLGNHHCKLQGGK